MNHADKRRANRGDARKYPASRRKRAIVLACVAAAMILFLSSRDLTWKNRHDSALERGRWAVNAGSLEQARQCFVQALIANPYSGEAHLALGELLDKRFGDNAGALEHYLAGLAYAPRHPLADEAGKAMAALEMIMTGAIEDPMDAAVDMATAAGANSFVPFSARLGSGPGAHALDYWRAWKERGLGALVQRRLFRNDAGDYNAVLGFAFPDGTSMSMHFFCRAGEPWRLILGFP